MPKIKSKVAKTIRRLEYEKQQVQEAKELNAGLDENTKLTRYSLYVAIVAMIIEVLQLILQ